jgi:O-antigen ligase
MSMLGLTLAAIKSEDAVQQGGGEATRQVFYVAVFLIALAASQPLTRPARLLALPATLVIALAWCGASVGWSEVAPIAMRRFVLTAMIIVALFRMVDQLGFERTVKVVQASLAMVLVLNFAAVASLPFAIHHMAEIGDPNLAGAWRGLLPQKNFAGAVCALTIIAFALDPLHRRAGGRWVLIVAAALFLYKTKSKTSIGLLLLSLSAGWAYLRYNPAYRALLIPVAVVLVPLVALYATGWVSSVLHPSDDLSGLTGRVQIWPPLFAYVRDHPLHGAGFGSFWNVGEASPIYRYGKGWVAKVGNGHNGYLDLATQIGIPGLILVVTAAFVAPLTRILASVSAPRAHGAVLVAMLLFCACHNFTETSLFDRDQIVEVFMMLTVALIAKVSGPFVIFRPTRRLQPAQRAVIPAHRSAP